MEVKPKKRTKVVRTLDIPEDDLDIDSSFEEMVINEHARYSKQNKTNRRKGHTFEREVVHVFKKTFPDARRNLEFQKEAAAFGVDLINTGRWHVQCKRGKHYVSPNRINEVKICPIEGGCPILLTRADNRPTLAVLPFDELMALIRFKELAERKKRNG